MSRKPFSILLSSAGRRVELMNCFRSDAEELGLDLRVVATDANAKMSSACQLADEGLNVPKCGEREFIPALLDICAKRQVRLLVPTIDPELEPFARHRKEFEKIGTRIAVSDPETIVICRDKLRTASFLAERGIPVPETASLAAVREQVFNFPIILKSREGSSSEGVLRIDKDANLRTLASALPNYIAQEQHQGIEYTVNLFFDEASQLRCAVPHVRVETRAGEVSKAMTQRNQQLLQLAERVGRALPDPFGVLCFQAIISASEEVAVFEINARFGGGFPLAHRAGAKFSKWLLEWAAELPPTITDQWQDGLTMLRYDTSTFF